MVRLFGALACGSLALVAAAQPAAAVTFPGSEALGDYNLIVLGDMSSSSEVEGRTFVGGSLSGQSATFQTRSLPASASGAPALTVVGNVTGAAKNLNNGGGATVGGNVANAFNMNGGNQTVRVGGTMPIGNVNGNTVLVGQSGTAGYVAGLRSERQALVSAFAGDHGLSHSLSLLGPTTADASVTIANNTATFEAAGAGLHVIDLDGSKLSGFGQIAFANAGTTVINVSGSNLIFDDNFLGSAGGLGQNVIWNLYQATTVSFGNAFYGSVLAPGALVTTRNFIEGSAVFGSLDQGGELHLAPFAGDLPSPGPVPEAASWAMMIAGFGLVGASMRRRPIAPALA